MVEDIYMNEIEVEKRENGDVSINDAFDHLPLLHLDRWNALQLGKELTPEALLDGEDEVRVLALSASGVNLLVMGDDEEPMWVSMNRVAWK